MQLGTSMVEPDASSDKNDSSMSSPAIQGANENQVGSDESPGSSPQVADLDFYEVLGVSRRASAEAIQQAYDMLSRIYHPGKSE